jgi:ubiquinone/menaquinone biosynthesis C-methylase UbiE
MEKKQKGRVKEMSHYFQFINPEMIASSLDIREGMKVADFGCGTGYFTFAFARKVGNSGIVYSIDVRKEKLEVIESGFRMLGINNVIVKRANLELKKDTGLRSSSLDWVILVNILFQNKKKKEILGEAKRVLKKSGKILLVEWRPEQMSIGPEKSERISKKTVANLINKSGLKIVREIPISQFHYGLILSQ